MATDRRIYKYHGILIGDDRVPTLIENSFDSDTRTMLENLVRDNDGTTQLLLDPTNTDQGYISYIPPSNIDETDDYFNFESFNFVVQLPLVQDGTIIINGSGEEHLYNIVMNCLVTDGHMNVQFPFSTNRTDENKVQAWGTLKNYLSNLECSLPATGIIKVNGHNVLITDVTNHPDTNKIYINGFDVTGNTSIYVELDKADFDVNDVKSVPIN